MGTLNRARTYLVGHMQYLDGQDWRRYVSKELSPLGIRCFNPYENNFHGLDEGVDTRDVCDILMSQGKLEAVSDTFKPIRDHDLSLVDRSDFIIANLHPTIASWGSAHEIIIASQLRRPTFISIIGGRNKCPFWLTTLFPTRYIYNCPEEIVDTIIKIDSGEIKIDSDRWRLLKEELR